MGGVGPRIAEAIVAARKAKGWSRAKLTVEADVGDGTIQSLEQGRFLPNFATLAKIAQVLDLDINELARLVPEPKGAGPRRGRDRSRTATVGKAATAGKKEVGGQRSSQLEALEADMAWYEANKSQLLGDHEGSYLAIVDRRVVDSDEDFANLAERVSQRYGRRPVFMPRCQKTERVVRIASPHVGR